MKKALPFLLYPALGLVAGWLSMPAPGAAPQAPASTTTSSRVREPRSAAPPATTEDLLRAARPREGGFGTAEPTGLAARLATWTDAEILAALDEAALRPDTLRRYDAIAYTLLAEYTRRDADRALAWALAQPPILSRKFVHTVISTWPAERVGEALAFYRKNPALFDGQLPVEIVTGSFVESARSGPQALLSRIAELKEDGLPPYSSFPLVMPPGFDFAALLGSPDFRALNLPNLAKDLLNAWMKQDREAAFQWVLRDSGPAGLIKLRPFPNGYTAQDPRWFIGKLETLTPQQREQFFKSNSSAFLQPGWNSVAWIHAASAPETKDAIRSAAARSIFSSHDSYIDRGLQAIGTLPDDESRLRAIETLEPAGTFRAPFTPSGEAILRRQLAAWGADDARAAAIVTRFKEQSAPSGKP